MTHLPSKLLDQISSSSTSYTDLTPPSGPKEYRIDINLPWTCTPTAMTTAYSTVSSNKVALLPIGVNGVAGAVKTMIVPNPSSDRITILGKMPSVVKVTDISGKEVIRVESTSDVSIQHLPKGMYMVFLYNGNEKMYHLEKLIRN
jgi:hypothetical protein